MAGNQPLCFALVEMHHGSDIGDAEIHIAQYVVVRLGRKEGNHSGAVVHIRDNFTPQVLVISKYSV